MIAFSSSPYFKQIYKSLAEAGFKIDALVTECPKPAGRGLKVCENPAHSFAKSVGLKVVTSLDEISESKILNQEMGIVFAYGQIIPQNIIDRFERGILNIHPSLLSKYRGPTPAQTALLNNDKKTGFSIIEICAKCDAGDIIYQKGVEIAPQDNYNALMDKIIKVAAQKMPEVCRNYLAGTIKPVKQDEAAATYTKKLNKTDGLITKSDNARTAINKIRAFSDWPKAYLEIDGKKVIIHTAKVEGDQLVIAEIQVAGKNKIKFSEFKNGYRGLLTKMPDFVKI